MNFTLSNEIKKEIINNLNIKIGNDINLDNIAEIQNNLLDTQKHLESCLNAASDEVPTKLSSAIKKAELNSKQIEKIREKMALMVKKADTYMTKAQPLMTELDKRFSAIRRLEEILVYFQSYARVEELSNQMKHCKDDEQLVSLYGEMKEMCNQYQNTHWNTYVKEYTHYWHNVLKDNLIRHYEDILKSLKWPFTSGSDNSQIPKEVLNKFNNLTRYLFLIREPKDIIAEDVTGDFTKEQDPCLPVKILLKPLKKRFTFHFTGSRQTARIDRPEWFLTQTLTWIKDHQNFVLNNVQPIADKLEIQNVNAVEEFNAGLIALAAERLHTVLAIYHTQSSKGEIVDVDAAFAHAVDETLGFHKELMTITDNEINNILSVLTKAETFVRWLSVEKKYALAKMDETLDSSQWAEPVAGGAGAAVGALLWVPRGADWFVSLLKTIEERYAILPQPGHRLQFLELQLELIEEWRIRLTQLLNAAAAALKTESFLVTGLHPLIAIVNTAHHTQTVLLQWAHCLHYLQLHYYKSQFQHFTQQQHREDESESSTSSEDDDEDSDDDNTRLEDVENMSLNDVEERAKKLALSEMIRRNSMLEISQYDVTSPITNLAVAEPLVEEDMEEAGVFGDAPALLAHLRDAGVGVLAEHIMLEFKATIRHYKKQKWHAMLTLEERALSVSGALCGPLSALAARVASAQLVLAPPLAAHLRAHLAARVDLHIYEEVVLESWFNTGGSLQFTHDVQRNLVPAFAPPNKNASQLNLLPKLNDACKLLNMDYGDARRIRTEIVKRPDDAVISLSDLGIIHIPPNEALRILNQRTDLCNSSSPSSVMDLF
ncbi:RAD50-interacting protein 1 isoform X2 [Nymphalis io]|uniref:RAD50-interacting protein 1 isoform X2 n=1 Tax=Inachis io TaxID=171585 RepID=UPI0021675D95|nr:RAD50-interacting protein 1 isoform X2 [Nymphalis io]